MSVKILIYVLDDSLTARTALEQALGSPFAVVQSFAGWRAFARACEQVTPDLVVLDMYMDRDAFELLHAEPPVLPRRPILAKSAVDDKVLDPVAATENALRAFLAQARVVHPAPVGALFVDGPIDNQEVQRAVLQLIAEHKKAAGPPTPK